MFDNCQLIALLARDSYLHILLVLCVWRPFVRRHATRNLRLPLPSQQPVATIFGNFYVNRITHPTSTLKIHKYFSAVNWEFARQCTRKITENVPHFNDNALRTDAAAAAAAAPKGCKTMIFIRMKWMFLKWKQFREENVNKKNSNRTKCMLRRAVWVCDSKSNGIH